MRKSFSVAATLALAATSAPPRRSPSPPAGKPKARAAGYVPLQPLSESAAPAVFRVKLRGHPAAVPIKHVSPQTLQNPPGVCSSTLRHARRARRKARLKLWARRGRS